MTAVDARLDELAERHGVDAAGRSALAALLEQLADEHAPTTVHDPRRAIETHIADSLAALDLPVVCDATGMLADIGAGAGLPGLALAAARPPLRVVEVESVGRKCAFIERAIGAMGLRNADVACARAEEWRDGFGRCDVVTARALAGLPVLVEYAAPLLREGGALVAWKGSPEQSELADGDWAADVLGLERSQSVEWRGPAGERSLYVYLKVRSLPNGYPRRAGMASKRPLRASTSA